MPDITYLPTSANFFEVSADQLLGMVPLPKEEYPPVNVLDCGCGLGFLGALFLPYLPKGCG